MRSAFGIRAAASVILAMGWLAASPVLCPANAAGPKWSIIVSTAPGLPQDVWFTGSGSNDVGWKGGGVICLNHLAQGFDGGEQLTLLVDVQQAGVYGPDGKPVPAGTYTFPGIDLPPVDYTVAEGKTYYVILNGYVVNSQIPGFDVGTIVTIMFMWDHQLGNNNTQVVSWMKTTTGFVPFLNEGIMKIVEKLHN